MLTKYDASHSTAANISKPITNHAAVEVRAAALPHSSAEHAAEASPPPPCRILTSEPPANTLSRPTESPMINTATKTGPANASTILYAMAVQLVGPALDDFTGVLELPPSIAVTMPDTTPATPPALTRVSWPRAAAFSTRNPPAKTRNAVTAQATAKAASQPAARPSHSRSESDSSSQLVNPTNTISAASCAISTHGTPRMIGTSRCE